MCGRRLIRTSADAARAISTAHQSSESFGIGLLYYVDRDCKRPFATARAWQTNGMTEFLGAAPVLPAHDIAETIDWFQRKLGFEPEFQYPLEHPVYAVVSRQGTEIHLRAAPVDAAQNRCQCYVGVTGVDDLYHEYLVRGVIHPAGDLEVKPWGQKEFAVLELNGATLVFGEGLEESESR
jgi:hypothetical protein